MEDAVVDSDGDKRITRFEDDEEGEHVGIGAAAATECEKGAR